MTASVNTMGWDTREPCSTCPYRRDVPPGTWHVSEFENLAAQDINQFGSIFGCHKTRKTGPQVCGGWLLDQKRRGLPCLTLRLRLSTNPAAGEALKQISDGGHSLYASIDEMCRVNGLRGAR